MKGNISPELTEMMRTPEGRKQIYDSMEPERNAHRTVSQRDYDFLMEKLENPGEPNEALKEAFRKYGSSTQLSLRDEEEFDMEVQSKAELDIEKLLYDFPNVEFGPAHIVLSDGNLGDGHIRWCLKLCRAALSGSGDELDDNDWSMMDELDWYCSDSPDSIRATIAVLEGLLLIPEDER